MKITIGNYTQVFDELAANFTRLEQNENNNVKETFKKINEKIKEVYDGGNALRKANSILKIGIVGQVKAGKSSFLNSLFFNGENVLPKASTPMTAGLTVLQYGEKNEFEVEYYNAAEWKNFEDKAKTYDDIIESIKSGNPSMTDEEAIKQIDIDPEYVAAKELVTSCKRNAKMQIQEKSKIETVPFYDVSDLQNILEKYVGANGDYTSIVKCLTIKLHDERLKDAQIVDTPGVNDPVLSREQRTRDFLRECHGVFFLSYSGRFFDSTDVSFLSERIGSQGIGEVVLIGSKFDSVLQDVGMKYRDDLGSAIDYCQRALKKQYETNIRTSEFQGKDPRLDFSSGIGFSIAQKDENRWDGMERHVVKQMTNFYPSFFSSSKDIKETFLNLSQISDIREKYVEHMFKERKDEIIQNKVNAYFNNSNNNLKSIIESERKKLSDKTESLRNTEVGEMEQKKKAFENIINHIKSDIQSIVNRMNDIAETSAKECLNAYSFYWNGNVPTESVTSTFVRKGTFWGGEKRFQCTYEKVNLNRLIGNVCTDFDRVLTSLSDNWSKKAEKIRKTISDTVGKIIIDNEMQDTEGNLDGKVLRNIVDETIDAMTNQATLNLADIKGIFRNALTNQLTGTDAITPTIGKTDETEAKNKVNAAAHEAKHKISSIVNKCVSSIYSDIKGMLEKAGQTSIKVLTNNKEKFFNSIKESTSDVLNNMEKELKDKKTNLQLLEEALNELTKIGNKL